MYEPEIYIVLDNLFIDMSTTLTVKGHKPNIIYMACNLFLLILSSISVIYNVL